VGQHRGPATTDNAAARRLQSSGPSRRAPIFVGPADPAQTLLNRGQHLLFQLLGGQFGFDNDRRVQKIGLID
jgi:hypothetical protein